MLIRYVGPALFSITMLLFSAMQLASAAESRAILDERFNWLTKEEADNTLRRIKQAGFNVFIPCIWHGRGVSWPSLKAKKEPFWEQKYKTGYDPLDYLITKAHQMDIEVHPWFTVVIRQGDFLPEFYDKGTPKRSFNIHLPIFRDYIVDVMMEVVTRYDVDGINLDYVRSKDICVSDFCINDYKRRYNRNLLKDVKEMQQDRWGVAANTIAAWNAYAVGEVVRRISEDSRKTKPDLIISVDTIVGMREFELQGADGIGWANKGWVDVVYHMDYQEKKKPVNRVFLNRGFQGLDDPDKLVLLAGNFSLFDKRAVPRDADFVNQIISFSRTLRRSGNGVALYQYRFLNEAQIDKLSNGAFKDIVRANWKKHR